MSKQVVRMRGRPASDFANKGEVSAANSAALASPTGREEGRTPDEDEPLSDFEEELKEAQAFAPPMTEVTHEGLQGHGSPYEDEDGLDDMERALRDAAEGPIGRRELGK